MSGLTAFDAQTTPLLPGKVVFVSPDRVTKPESGESWFTAVVEVDAAGLKDHPHVRLQAGMPAELYVTPPGAQRRRIPREAARRLREPRDARAVRSGANDTECHPYPACTHRMQPMQRPEFLGSIQSLFTQP